MPDHDLPNLRPFLISVAPSLPHLDHGQFHDGATLRRLDMHMRRLVFVGPEEEAVRPDPKEGGHADLVTMSAVPHHRAMHSPVTSLI